jgi:DNA-binding transcriptional LysR family regulator
MSRRIGALEQRSGARLFNRTTRRVELTNVGDRYLERCGHLVDEARLAQEALNSEVRRPGGHLRVSMPVDLGVLVVAPLLPAFARLYPDISFELDLSPQYRDMLGEHVDVALRLGTVRDENLVSRRVGWIAQGLYGAPGYLERRGRPEHPNDLAQHDCIFIGSGKAKVNWRLAGEDGSHTVSVQGRFSVNNHGMMRALAEREMGIAVLDPSLCRDAIAAGRLVPVLSDWAVPRLAVHAVTTSRLHGAAARAFIEFVADRFASR